MLTLISELHQLAAVEARRRASDCLRDAMGQSTGRMWLVESTDSDAILSGLGKFVVDADAATRLSALAGVEAMAKAQGGACDSLVDAGFPKLLCERCGAEKDLRCLRLVLESLAGCSQAADGTGCEGALAAGAIDAVLRLLAAREQGGPGADAGIVEAAARALVGLTVPSVGKAAFVKEGGCPTVGTQLQGWAEAARGAGGSAGPAAWTAAVRALGQLCSLVSLAAVDDDAKRAFHEAGVTSALVGVLDPSELLGGGSSGEDAAGSAGSAPSPAAIPGSQLARATAAEAPRAAARAAGLASAQACRAVSAVCALPAARAQALELKGHEAAARASAFAKEGGGLGAGSAAAVLLSRAAGAAHKVLVWKS